MTKQYSALQNGALAVPRTMLNQLLRAMEIFEYSAFRPATSGKDFDKEIKDFIEQRDSFLKFIQEAVAEDRIYKLSRTNWGKALESILDPGSPILTEIKNGFVEISFVVKLK